MWKSMWGFVICSSDGSRAEMLNMTSPSLMTKNWIGFIVWGLANSRQDISTQYLEYAYRCCVRKLMIFWITFSSMDRLPFNIFYLKIYDVRKVRSDPCQEVRFDVLRCALMFWGHLQREIYIQSYKRILAVLFYFNIVMSLDASGNAIFLFIFFTLNIIYYITLYAELIFLEFFTSDLCLTRGFIFFLFP